MILSCNACEKKFVVPDQAITAAGRIVQCGSCGSKWRQFPIENKSKNATENLKKNKIVSKKTKPKRKNIKKTREVSLYSPEYLAQKHGIRLNNVKSNIGTPKSAKVSFGFYNSLILFVFIIIVLSRTLYFFQDLIIQEIPVSQFYLNYFFESVKNIFEIAKDLITNY